MLLTIENVTSRQELLVLLLKTAGFFVLMMALIYFLAILTAKIGKKYKGKQFHFRWHGRSIPAGGGRPAKEGDKPLENLEQPGGSAEKEKGLDTKEKEN